MKASRERAGESRLNDDLVSLESAEAARPTPDFLALAFKHKWLLLAGLAVGLTLGQAAYIKLGPAFQATSRILVSKRTTAQIKDGGESAAYGERGEHVALIMSPLIVGEAVKKHQLDRLASLKDAKDPVDSILGNLLVKRTAGSDRSLLNVLDITCKSRTPRDSTAIVSAITDAYSDYLAKTERDHTAETVSLISKANDELHKKLREKEQAYIAFRQKSPLHWRNAPGTTGQAGDTTNVHQERMFAIEADRRTNLLRQTEINSKLKAIEQAQARGDSRESLELLVRRYLSVEGGQAASAPLADPSSLAAVEARLLPLILKERELLRDFGPDHPDVVAVHQGIEATREFYRQQGVRLPDSDLFSGKSKREPAKSAVAAADPVAAYVESLKLELEVLAFRERELTASSSEESKAAKAYAGFQLEDQTLSDEIQRLKTMWEQVVTRLNEINLLDDNGGYSLKVMAPPREELDIKRHIKIAGAGSGVGLLLSFGIILLRSLRDTTLKTVDDVQRQLTFNLLGRVPQIDFKVAAKPRPGSTLDPSLLYFHQPGSTEAEAYRSVRTALFVSTHSGGQKVIQVTSSEPQDGKTTLICNLASAMAQAGKKVLLIDADLRCPKVFKLFGFKQEIGLSDVLTGEIDLATAIHATEIDGLSILGSGLSPANPAEILGGGQFQQMLRDVRSEFDFVLVDTPPLLAVSDPCIVAPYTDGVLFVVRLGKNRRETVTRAQELLLTHEMNVLGVVINGVPADGPYGDGYGYGYGAYTRPSVQKAVGSRPVPEAVHAE